MSSLILSFRKGSKLNICLFCLIISVLFTVIFINFATSFKYSLYRQNSFPFGKSGLTETHDVVEGEQKREVKGDGDVLKVNNEDKNAESNLNFEENKETKKDENKKQVEKKEDKDTKNQGGKKKEKKIPEVKITKDEICGVYCNFDNNSGIEPMIIPNFVHYVLFDVTELELYMFLSICSALKIQKPEKLFFHSNTMELHGRYFHSLMWLLENIYYDKTKKKRTIFEMHYLPKPTEIYGVHISSVEHARNFVSLQVLKQHGGIYLHNDQIVLKSLSKFRHFEMSIGWPDGDDSYMGNQILIAVKDARFLNLWLKSYHQYDPKQSHYNTNELPTKALLWKHPKLVHREPTVFGVDGQEHVWSRDKWTEWNDYYSIHLDMESASNKVELNLTNVTQLGVPVSDISRLIFYDIEPEIDFGLFKD